MSGKKVKSCNLISILIGVVITLITYLIFDSKMAGTDPMIYGAGVFLIGSVVFGAGLKKVPIVSLEAIKVFGKRWEGIGFREGWRWIPWFIVGTEEESEKIEILDAPVLVAITKDKVPMETDVQIFWRVSNLAVFLRLEKETVIAGLTSRVQEANRAFVIAKTYEECLTLENDLQDAIEDTIEEENNWGIEITSVDVRSILPPKQVREELQNDKNKEIRTKRFKTSVKEIKNGIKGLSPDVLANTVLVIHGDVKKEIKDSKQTLKLDFESESLGVIIEAGKALKSLLKEE